MPTPNYLLHLLFIKFLGRKKVTKLQKLAF